ncbi:TetR/AcrR family transcriptional regulator [Desulfosporosinus sp.]|uniref:TetR/AcrR family transcriptional regulator n=1 Tax=Desulfosporosinus sp. TaxID=157907 RepID=UPI0025C0BBC0|nr:TetR/AcrR family transcriptional regulator [Desulfosporosinus sp.]MBC2721452.1 TetR/AcrR family transcriptional regulator [Desulfosporosinus sp.]MBC2727508.1 TetR/AcrR family transcriptional regulator [Desulfosporosinus sp.]
MKLNQETQQQKSSRKKTADERRQDILEAAINVFTKKGYNGSTTAEIARAAGVAEGTIFRHFATKKELLIAVLTPKILNGIISLDKEHKDPVEFFRCFLRDRLELIKENEGLVRFMFAEAQYHNEVREALFNGILGQGISIVKPWFDKGVKEGVFKPVPFPSMMRSFMGTVLFYGIFNHVFPGFSPERTIEEAADQILDLFLHGLLVE